jgi:hypothetical protein
VEELTIWLVSSLLTHYLHPVQLDLQTHCGILLASFERLLHRPLLNLIPGQTAFDACQAAPFVIVSHGNEPDPILNYGNPQALQLWEMAWEEFVRTPSRYTAEPINRDERARLLARVTSHGFIDDYQGVRISKNGKRFLIEQAVVCNLHTAEGIYHGQAATFSKWKFL